MGRGCVPRPLPVSDATEPMGGDPIPAQGSLAPGYDLNTGADPLILMVKTYFSTLRWRPTLRGHEGCCAPPEGRADIPHL